MEMDERAKRGREDEGEVDGAENSGNKVKDQGTRIVVKPLRARRTEMGEKDTKPKSAPKNSSPQKKKRHQKQQQSGERR